MKLDFLSEKLAEILDRIDRIGFPTLVHLKSGNIKGWVRYGREVSHNRSLLRVRQIRRFLVRRQVGWHKNNLVQIKFRSDFLGNRKMAIVNWVECPAKKGDGFHAPVGPSGSFKNELIISPVKNSSPVCASAVEPKTDGAAAGAAGTVLVVLECSSESFLELSLGDDETTRPFAT